MFLKETRDITTKGRTVAAGKKQRDFISKEYSSSLSISNEAVILSCIIDADNTWDVSVIDTPN